MELAGLWTGYGGQGVVGDVMSANLTASKASTNEAITMVNGRSQNSVFTMSYP